MFKEDLSYTEHVVSTMWIILELRTECNLTCVIYQVHRAGQVKGREG